MSMDEETLGELRKLVKDAKRIVFLGGAGVSTASGIPDFRSPEGLYNVRSKYGRPYEEMLSLSFFEEDPETFYDFYWSTMVSFSAKPNLAHLALADFEKRHPNKLTIITQNIDGLHQKAGSKRVLEIHGSTASYTCPTCGKRYALDEIKHHGVPRCSCGGVIKPDVVLYEEALPEDAFLGAMNATRFANLLIVGGTSLRVQPAAMLPGYFSGGKSVLINAEPTPLDDRFDYVLRDDVGQALSAILGGEL